jgi:hypothetical protein
LDEQNQFDVFMEALRGAGVAYARPESPEQLFINLKVPVPNRPQQFIETLEVKGEMWHERDNDDAISDATSPIKRACYAYRPGPGPR